MKTIFKSIIVLISVFVFAFCFVSPSFAAIEQGKLTVVLEDADKNKIDGMTINISQVAEFKNSDYSPTQAFENSNISISALLNNPNEMTAKSIVNYIKNNNIDNLSTASQNGKAVFSELSLGIWVVYSDDESGYIFNPYIVFLPFESEGKLYYEVLSTPKLENIGPDEINIYVVKKWDDKNNVAKKRPESITVELLNGEKVVGEVLLSEANAWSHTFLKLSKDGDYSVREKKVADYKATYSGDTTNGFIITNSYAGEKLPHTGQYWWPIVIIAIAGAGLLVLGIYEIGVKKNGSKK